MRKVLPLILFVIFCNISKSYANISLISDAQTQKLLEELSAPLIKAANLEKDHINIYIVNDSRINAFVTRGQNIFINTGLIRKFKTPDSLIGVVAHEVGHIASGHIARSSEEYKKAQNTAIAGYILGIAAIIAGSPEAGQGILIGGTDIATKSMLKHTRTQEEAADKNALVYLNKIKYPSDGLVKLLEEFERSTVGLKGYINEYMLSHPISKKRIEYLKNNAPKNFSNRKVNLKLQPQMDMVLAKLEGFVDDPDQVIKKYQGQDTKYAKYALSVAYYRDAQIAKSIQLLDDLIKESRSDNGFFYEFKAQIYYETGQMSPAIYNYKRAIDEIANNEYSIDARLYLSKSILNLAKYDRDLINYAIDNLIVAKRYRPNSPFLYKQLYTAYNNLDNKALAYYNYANYNYLIGKIDRAYKYVKKSQEEFSKNKQLSQGDKLKLEDLAQIIQNDKRFKKIDKKQ